MRRHLGRHLPTLARPPARRLWNVPKDLFGWPLGYTDKKMSEPPDRKDVPGAEGAKKTDKPGDKKQEKSYFATAVDSINPWNTSRSGTPVPKEKEMPPPPKPKASNSKKADDHSLTTLYGQSFRKYPLDCPPLNVKWFHAVDVSAIPESPLPKSALSVSRLLMKLG